MIRHDFCSGSSLFDSVTMWFFVTRQLTSIVCITMLFCLQWVNCIHRHTNVQPKPKAQNQGLKHIHKTLKLPSPGDNWWVYEGVSFAAMMLWFFGASCFQTSFAMFFLCPDFLTLRPNRSITCVPGKVQIHQGRSRFASLESCHGRFLPKTESKREQCQCKRGRIRGAFLCL